MMFRRLMWTNFVYYILAVCFYLGLSVNSTSQISNFDEFRQLQIPNAQSNYHDILPVHTKHYDMQLGKSQIDILNLNTTFWHCKNNPITFEQGYALMSQYHFRNKLQNLIVYLRIK